MLTGGQYKKIVTLHSSIHNNTLRINEVFEHLKNYNRNEKLDAHKVIDSQIEIDLPFHLSIFAEIENATVSFSGNYEYLNVEQKRGSFVLNTQTSNGIIKTVSAHVYVNGIKNAYSVKSKTITKDTLFSDKSQPKLSIESYRGEVDIN